MSKTPRTDEQELAYVAEDGSTYVHTTFARKLEREIRQLEVAIYDGKKENEELRKQLAEIIHLNQAVSMLAGLPTAKEMDTLVKDGKRLDWLLDENSCNHIERGCYNQWGNWLGKTLHNRSDIDREMEEL